MKITLYKEDVRMEVDHHVTFLEIKQEKYYIITYGYIS